MEQQVWSLQRARRSTLRPRVAVPSPHGVFQVHAAHAPEWSGALNTKGSLGTWIPNGVTTFPHVAFTAHGAEAVGGQVQCLVRRGLDWGTDFSGRASRFLGLRGGNFPEKDD